MHTPKKIYFNKNEIFKEFPSLIESINHFIEDHGEPPSTIKTTLTAAQIRRIDTETFGQVNKKLVEMFDLFGYKTLSVLFFVDPVTAEINGGYVEVK